MSAATNIRARIEKEAARELKRFRAAVRGVYPRECPICEYQGKFTAFGFPPRFDARCAGCGSLERHRLFALALQRTALFQPNDRVLHFAPEQQLTPLIRPLVGTYETADRSERRMVDHRVDIEGTGLPDESFDKIVCNHVMEHVDDVKGLAECFRLLAPGGALILSAPVVEGWAKTYENDEIATPEGRRQHFGQADHRRLYGRDIRDRIRAAGFALAEVTAEEPDVQRFGLMRGETLFIATKAAAPGGQTEGDL